MSQTVIFMIIPIRLVTLSVKNFFLCYLACALTSEFISNLKKISLEPALNLF
jgi:uncharacterized membrane protein YwzB